MFCNGFTHREGSLRPSAILAFGAAEEVCKHFQHSLCHFSVPLLTLILRAFAKIYIQDKVVSSLLGRPPRLCRRYCFMQLPLDISDSCLSLPQDQLEAMVGHLDAGGWNQVPSIRGPALMRACLICDMLREDILELALTTVPQNDDAIAQ
jgi:hypothetical protein